MKKLIFDSFNYYVISSWNEFSLNSEIEKKAKNASKILIVSDSNVYPLYGESIKNNLTSFNTFTYILDSGDKEKNIDNYNKIIEFLIDNKFTRSDVIISLGGGMVSDLAGFVASTFKRGVKHVILPTSIIGQVDASVGGKVAINFNNLKNQVGNFYDPIMVIANLDYLKTLPDEEYKSGLGEIIKTGLIGDYKLFTYFENGNKKITEDILIKSIDVKKKFIEKDYYDHSERACLNLGHSFAHAIESLSNFTLPHGIAVLEGIIMALDFGEYLKITSQAIKPRLLNIIKSLNIEYNLPHFRDCLDYLKNDKKANHSGINLITLTDFEKPVIIHVAWEDFNAINS